MKYNIIGDIHGRTTWKNLVIKDGVNIFVGDYFSPYKPIPFESQLNNFMDIVLFKMQYPETIMLIGNHDEDHWHIHEQYSRFDRAHFNDIKQVFEENKDFLQVSYSIENKALVTHAGVSMLWYDRYMNHNLFGNIIDLTTDEPDEVKDLFNDEKTVKIDKPFKPNQFGSVDEAYEAYYEYKYPHFAKENKKPRDGEFVLWKNNIWTYNNNKFNIFSVSPDDISEFINTMWLQKRYSAFNFDNNANPSDCYGDSEKHGPLWIRPESLIYTNIFKFSNIIQFVGHTQFQHPVRILDNHISFINEIPINEHEVDKIVWLDCLGFNTESIIYNTDANFVEINKEKIT